MAHLPVRVTSIDHGLEFVRESSDTTSIGLLLIVAGANVGLVSRRNRSQAYVRRVEGDAGVSTPIRSPPRRSVQERTARSSHYRLPLK